MTYTTFLTWSIQILQMKTLLNKNICKLFCITFRSFRIILPRSKGWAFLQIFSRTGPVVFTYVLYPNSLSILLFNQYQFWTFFIFFPNFPDWEISMKIIIGCGDYSKGRGQGEGVAKNEFSNSDICMHISIHIYLIYIWYKYRSNTINPLFSFFYSMFWHFYWDEGDRNR